MEKAQEAVLGNTFPKMVFVSALLFNSQNCSGAYHITLLPCTQQDLASLAIPNIYSFGTCS